MSDKEANIIYDHLSKDYQLKVDYLNSHFGRIWNRFSFFLTIELSVFGVLGFFFFKMEEMEQTLTIIPVVLGGTLSIVWWLVSYQDRQLVKIYRDAIYDVSGKLAEVLKSSGQADTGFVQWVKSVPVGGKDYYNHTHGNRYSETFSITLMPVYLAIFTLSLWILIGTGLIAVVMGV